MHVAVKSVQLYHTMADMVDQSINLTLSYHNRKLQTSKHYFTPRHRAWTGLLNTHDLVTAKYS